MDSNIHFRIIELVAVQILAQINNFDIFWPNLPQKGILLLKMKRVNTTIEFYIFELVLVSNFSLHQQFLFFGPNFPKVISGLKQKK